MTATWRWGLTVAAVVVSVYFVALVGLMIRMKVTPAAAEPSVVASAPPAAIATTGRVAAPTPRPPKPAAIGAGPIDELRGHDLLVPVAGADVEKWKGAFDETRDGSRPHEAVDILAPRNTPIRAVDDGTIAKLFLSRQGGITIYQFDPGGRYAYYYAHLERYADGLREGAAVARGQVIGYVGTSGNAPPGTPHLHFAVFLLGPDRHWWQGRPIDPYDVYARR